MAADTGFMLRNYDTVSLSVSLSSQIRTDTMMYFFQLPNASAQMFTLVAPPSCAMLVTMFTRPYAAGVSLKDTEFPLAVPYFLLNLGAL